MRLRGVALPVAAPQERVGLEHLADARDQQSKGQVRDGRDVGGGTVGDGDAALASGVKVDAFVPAADAATSPSAGKCAIASRDVRTAPIVISARTRSAPRRGSCATVSGNGGASGPEHVVTGREPLLERVQARARRAGSPGFQLPSIGARIHR